MAVFKDELRRSVRQLRDSLTQQELTDRSERACTCVLALLQQQDALDGTVALYAAKDSELQTQELAHELERAGIATAYPRVATDHDELVFHRATLAELTLGTFGIREPAESAPVVPVVRIGAFVVPGLAFDLKGNRLGWGRGFYDTILTRADTALRIGVGFDCQLVPTVSTEKHDAAMHFVVTDEGIRARTSTGKGAQ